MFAVARARAHTRARARTDADAADIGSTLDGAATAPQEAQPGEPTGKP